VGDLLLCVGMWEVGDGEGGVLGRWGGLVRGEGVEGESGRWEGR